MCSGSPSACTSTSPNSKCPCLVHSSRPNRIPNNRAGRPDLSAEDIKDFCKGKLAHFKIPKHVRFVEGFPTTVTGKIQKFKMREEDVKRLGLKEGFKMKNN